VKVLHALATEQEMFGKLFDVRDGLAAAGLDREFEFDHLGIAGHHAHC
jgi:hypothetical protein